MEFNLKNSGKNGVDNMKSIIENEIEFKFLKKKCEGKMYNQLRKRFIKNGYKPLNNVTYTFSHSCRDTKTYYGRSYPLKMIIRTYSRIEQMELAA